MAPEHPKTKLDREIDEILAKKSKEPIPFSSHPRAPKHASTTHDLTASVASAWRMLLAMPLMLALVLGIAGTLIHDLSPLLSLVFFTGAVAAIWLPGILRLTGPGAPASSSVKYWRGRPYASDVRDAVSRSPVESIKRYFDRRR